MIEFRNVSVTYRGGVRALRDVDLSIGDGEFVVVVGLSGAGKSTLLRALNGLVPATSGSITVDGTEVVGASPADLRAVRSRVGMIFQTFNLATRTSVVNNVLMGRLSRVPSWRSTLGLWPAADREAAMVALERVGIVEKAFVRAADLSGGGLRTYCRPSDATHVGAPAPGHVRASSETLWEFRPLDDGSTQGYFEGVVDPKGALPKWMVNEVGKHHSVNMLRAITSMAGRVLSSNEHEPKGWFSLLS